MIEFLVFICILGIGSFIYYRRQVSKLKNFNYFISSFLDKKNRTHFYIVYEKRKGFFLKAKTLADKHTFLFSKEIASILSKKYTTEEEAVKGLLDFKSLFNCKNCSPD